MLKKAQNQMEMPYQEIEAINYDGLLSWFLHDEEVAKLATQVGETPLLQINVEGTVLELPLEVPDLLEKAINDDKDVFWVGPNGKHEPDYGVWEINSAKRAVLRTLTKMVYETMGEHYASLIK